MEDRMEIEILKEARLLRRDPSLVLPELNIPMHPYPIYVYAWKFLWEGGEIETILKELKVGSYPEITDLLDDLKERKIEKCDDVMLFLKEFGLKYVDEFLKPYPLRKEGEFLQPIRD